MPRSESHPTCGVKAHKVSVGEAGDREGLGFHERMVVRCDFVTTHTTFCVGWVNACDSWCTRGRSSPFFLSPSLKMTWRVLGIWDTLRQQKGWFLCREYQGLPDIWVFPIGKKEVLCMLKISPVLFWERLKPAYMSCCEQWRRAV